jgi:hypothetical protein
MPYVEPGDGIEDVDGAIPPDDTAQVPDADAAVDVEVPPEDGGPAKECLEPNPAGCTQTLCAEGEVCDPTQGCKPSSCFCAEDSGEWSCTKDCGGGICVDKAPDQNVCPGPNPAGCMTEGCPGEYTCVSDPSICVPTACECDVEVGSWLCTADCSGGLCKKDEGLACEDPDPTSCLFKPCPVGMECDEDAEGCFPSSCNCDEDSGEWGCTKDCHPGKCAPIVGALPCLKPDPTSCTLVGCSKGFVCDETDDACSPSSCICDGSIGQWNCTKDCLPGLCVPEKPVIKLCKLPNPESCVTAGCLDGKECDANQGCMPSQCWCDGLTGTWACTADCVPGLCVDPKDPGGCDTPNPAGCFSTGCPGSMQCVLEGCTASSCSCEAGVWSCTEDCGGGTCVDKAGEVCAPEDLETDAGCMTCDEALAAASAEAETNLGNATAGCQADKDCVMVSSSTDCYGMCPVAVRSFWAVKYVNKMGMVSAAYCTGYQDKCPYMTPGCLPAEPACVDGVCAAVPAPP